MADTPNESTTAPAGPDAESEDLTRKIGDPDAPARGVLDPTLDDPPEANEPA